MTAPGFQEFWNALFRLPQLQPIPVRGERLHLLAVFTLLFIAYALTAPRTIALEDDGLFVLSSYFLGNSHPPGYPLYSFIGNLFTWIPLGSVAYRAHLASAFLGATACVSAWWCVRLLVPGRVPAYTAALVLGFSRTFWSQSIIAEVYSLNCLFFFSLLALCLTQLRRAGLARDGVQESPRLLLLIALLSGLSLSNHWPLMVLGAPALLILMLPQWKQIVAGLHKLLPMFLLGLLPYAWMVWRSHTGPLISFYGPIGSWQEFWFYISRQGYSGVDESVTATAVDTIQFLVWFTRQLVVEFGIPALALAAVGFVRQFFTWGPGLVLALITGFFCSGPLLVILLGFDFDPFHAAVFSVYPLIAYGIVSLWMGLGIAAVIEKALGRVRFPMARASLAAGVSLAVVAVSVAGNLEKNSRAGYAYSTEYATAVLNSLDKNAIFFLDDDVSFGVIGYLHLVEGLRPDIDLYNQSGLVLSNRLFHPRRSSEQEMVEHLFAFINNSERPVYFAGSITNFVATSELGFYKKFRNPDEPGRPFELHPELFEALERLLAVPDRGDYWTEMHQAYLSREFGRVLGGSGVLSAGSIGEQLGRYPKLTGGNFHGLLGIALGATSVPEDTDYEVLRELLTRIRPLVHAGMAKRDLGEYFFVLGLFFTGNNEYMNAIQQLEASESVWPHPANPAILQLMILYLETNRVQNYRQLRSQYFGTGELPGLVRELDARLEAMKPE